MGASDIASEWRYKDSVPTDRQIALASPAFFEELVTLAKAEICKVRARVEPGREPGLADCLQPVFSFELPTVGDRLFNGPYGYRASYWRDPFCGLKANASLIAALTSKLLAAMDGAADPDISKIDVCASLRATSAKFWIQEIPSLLAHPTVDLNVERWVAEANRGVQLARWGLSAPEVTKFDVKGALLDPHGNEVVPLRKIGRHYDIHHYGFS
jgi:hypothetical protein